MTEDKRRIGELEAEIALYKLNEKVMEKEVCNRYN